MATIDIRLEVGSAQETLSVAAEAPVIETSRSSSAATITDKAVANLPVNGRNFIDLPLLSPGVVRDVRGTGDISFAGQRGTANTMLVDGADSNNLFYGPGAGPHRFPSVFVQRGRRAGIPGEHGRLSGGDRTRGRRRHQYGHQIRNQRLSRHARSSSIATNR